MANVQQETFSLVSMNRPKLKPSMLCPKSKGNVLVAKVIKKCTFLCACDFMNAIEVVLFAVNHADYLVLVCELVSMVFLKDLVICLL